MDVIEKVIGSIVTLVVAIYLLVNGLAPALAGVTNLTIGGIDYFWAVGLMVIILVFGIVVALYKQFSTHSKK